MPSRNTVGWLVVFGISFASCLFSIAVFQLLQFIHVPAVFFLLFLLVGIPIGSLVALRNFGNTRGDLDRCLIILGITAVVCIALYLACSRYTSLISVKIFTAIFYRTGEVVASLAFSLGLLVLIFISFFIAYGMTEFQCYRWARQRGVNTGAIYAGILLGAVLAFVTFKIFLGDIGVSRFLLAGLGVLLLLVSWGKKKEVALGGLVVLAAVWVIPGLESIFLSQAMPRGEGIFFVPWNRARGCRTLYEGWHEQIYITILENQEYEEVLGFYNGIGHWVFDRKELPDQEKRLVFMQESPLPFITQFLPPNPDMLVIGAGGGRDIQLLEKYDPSRIVAVEVVPGLIPLFTGPLRDAVNDIYNRPNVAAYTMDGRQYLRQDGPNFDLILMPWVENSFATTQTFLDPSDRLYTIDSLRRAGERLNPGGVLAIFKTTHIDPAGLLFKQYFTALREIGLTTYAIRDPYRFVVVGVNREVPVDEVEVFRPDENEFITEIADPEKVTLKTDDRPFGASVYLQLFGPANVVRLTGALGLFFVLVLVVITFWLGRSGIRIGTGSFAGVAGASVLVGVNFVLMQSTMIFRFYDFFPSPLEVYFTAMIIFLAFTSLGGVVYRWRYWPLVLPAVPLLYIVLLASYEEAGLGLTLLALGIPSVMTGVFFPTLLEGPERRMLTVFAMDAVGALLGSILSAMIPVFIGFRAFYGLTFGVLLFTFVVVLFGVRRKGVVLETSETAKEAAPARTA